MDPQQANSVFSWILGINAAVAVTIFAGAAKLIWYLAKADSRIEAAHAAAIRAHKRIDNINKDGDCDGE
jgi:hypothetical protein